MQIVLALTSQGEPARPLPPRVILVTALAVALASGACRRAGPDELIREHFAENRPLYAGLSLVRAERPCRAEGRDPYPPALCSGGGAKIDDPGVRRLAAAAAGLFTPDAGPAELRHQAYFHLLWPGLNDSLEKAIAALRAAAALDGEDARIHTDLGAVYLTAAGIEALPSLLPAAFEHTERAISLDPGLPAARFNRALILETLRLGEAADKAWRDYLDLDGGGALWRRDAEEALRRLSQPSDEERWFEARTELDRLLDREDRPPLERLVAKFPQRARELVEESLLPEWAGLWRTGRDQRAWPPLRRARLVADALKRATGERLGLEALVELEAARGEPDDLDRLAAAHLELDAARRAYHRSDPGSALAALARAAGGFGESSSMAPLVSYYRAASLYSEERYAEARVILGPLAEQAAGRGYLHLEGKIAWTRGLIDYLTGDAESGSRHLAAAVATFSAAGEKGNRAFVHALQAESHAFLGDHDRAWELFLRALEDCFEVGRPYRQVQIYNTAADFVLRRGQIELSYRFQDAAVRAARQIDNPSFRADVILWRALLEHRLRRPEAVRRDLELAAREAVAIEDPARRQQFEADLGLIRGTIRERQAPAEAVRLLSPAIAQFETASRWPSLLLAYEARARAHHRLGDRDGERRDLERGLELWQLAGRQVEDDSLRLTLARDVETAFEQMARFEADAGRPDGAFRTIERARALLHPGAIDNVLDPAAVARRLPARAALVEYGVLDDRLLVWAITSERVIHAAEPVGRHELRRLIGAVREEPWGGDGWRRASGRLFSLLIGRHLDLAELEMLVVVPADLLFGLSFPGLWDEATERYLVEEVATVISPGASLFFHYADADRRRAASDMPADVLILAGPKTDRRPVGLPALPWAAAEGLAIESRFPGRSVLLTGAAATRAAFAARAPSSRFLHLATHAVADASRPSGSFLLLAPDDGDDGRLRGTEIQRLELDATRLVTLSACDTGAVPGRAWSGSLNLARPFLAAGAPAVVASLWPVEDREAAGLFDRFYELLAEGVEPAEALRQAQLSQIATLPAGARRLTWPAFQLIGGTAAGSQPEIRR